MVVAGITPQAGYQIAGNQEDGYRFNLDETRRGKRHDIQSMAADVEQDVKFIDKELRKLLEDGVVGTKDEAQRITAVTEFYSKKVASVRKRINADSRITKIFIKIKENACLQEERWTKCSRINELFKNIKDFAARKEKSIKKKKENKYSHITEKLNEVDGFDKEVYAQRLGVPVEVFQGIEGEKLYKFLSSNFLHKKIEYFTSDSHYRNPELFDVCDETMDHKLTVNDDGEVCMLFNGKRKKWSEVYNKLFDDNGVLKNPFTYTYEGIKPLPGDFVDRKQLIGDDFKKMTLQNILEKYFVIFDRKNPKKCNGKWIFSILWEGDKKRHRPRGDHSWARIQTPDGKIYSVGFARKIFGFAMSEGIFEQGDTFEYSSFGGKHTKVDFEATRGGIKEILIKILSDIRDFDTGFDVRQHNCTSYSKFFLRCIGVDMRPEMHVIKYLEDDSGYYRRHTIPKKTCRYNYEYITTLCWRRKDE